MKVYQSQAFVYKWIHVPTGMWYIGSRTAKGCHLTDGYICSSNKVKMLILENSSNWIREILGVGTPVSMRALEATYLSSLDAANNPLSYNEHNNNGKFNYQGGKAQSPAHREKISKALTGIVRSAEYCAKMSAARKGKPNPKHSLATKDKKEMCLSHFNRWCNRQDNPQILKDIFSKLKGVPKTKVVCRIVDKKELTLGRFNKWLAKIL